MLCFVSPCSDAPVRYRSYHALSCPIRSCRYICRYICRLHLSISSVTFNCFIRVPPFAALCLYCGSLFMRFPVPSVLVVIFFSIYVGIPDSIPICYICRLHLSVTSVAFPSRNSLTPWGREISANQSLLPSRPGTKCRQIDQGSSHTG